MNAKEAIQHIKDNSVLLNQLQYNKRTKTSNELRAKEWGKHFILVTYEDGNNGFDIYFPNTSNNCDQVIKQFDSL